MAFCLFSYFDFVEEKKKTLRNQGSDGSIFFFNVRSILCMLSTFAAFAKRLCSLK